MRILRRIPSPTLFHAMNFATHGAATNIVIVGLDVQQLISQACESVPGGAVDVSKATAQQVLDNAACTHGRQNLERDLGPVGAAVTQHDGGGTGGDFFAKLGQLGRRAVAEASFESC